MYRFGVVVVDFVDEKWYDKECERFGFFLRIELFSKDSGDKKNLDMLEYL